MISNPSTHPRRRRFFKLSRACLAAALALSNATGALHAQADFLDSFVNPAIQPAEDFYAYAQGAWAQNPRNTKSSITDQLYTENGKKMEAIVEDLLKADSGTLGGDAKRLSQFWKGALNFEQANREGIQPLRPYLALIDAITTPEQAIAVTAQLAPLQLDIFFTLEVVTPSLGNSLSRMFGLGNGYDSLAPIGLSTKESYFEAKTADAYRRYIEKMLALAGIANAKDQARVIFDFEKALAPGYYKLLQASRPDQVLTFGELKKTVTPTINWSKHYAGLGVTDQTPVQVWSKNYLRTVNDLLVSQPIETVKAYMRFRVLDELGRFLTDDFHNAFVELYMKPLALSKGPFDRTTRVRRGVELAEWYREAPLLSALGKSFVEQHVSDEMRQFCNTATADCKEAYRNLINASWLSAETKAEALRKIDKLNVELLHPREGYWPQIGALDTTGNTPARAILNLHRWGYHRNMRSLGTISSPHSWDGMGLWEPNAFAYYEYNSIYVPAGLLLFPGFSWKSPDVATAYGLVTSTIAHEMGHILDPEGRKYDADGLQVRGWKNPADSANYDLKSKLIQNQFAAVVIPELPGVKLNAANTNIEDVADFSGMQICIKALESRLAKIRSVNPRDPNLLPDKKDRTPWQRFFIGCSAQMASNHSKAELKEWINAEFHTPEKWRTNVVLPNFAQFQRAFNIPADSPMYREPHRRVNVW